MKFKVLQLTNGQDLISIFYHTMENYEIVQYCLRTNKDGSLDWDWWGSYTITGDERISLYLETRFPDWYPVCRITGYGKYLLEHLSSLAEF